jgi:hypothetical protein
VARRVPVLGQEHMRAALLEVLHESVDWPNDAVAVGNRECASRQEIVLHIDHKECVTTCLQQDS